jgi:hypothetical protein
MPKEPARKTFIYNAHGHALSGHIQRPFDQIIEVQAGTSLPTIGGHGSARMDNYQLRQFISFKSGYSHVSGSQNEKDGSYTTLVSSTVEGLNILDVVTADRVVARLSCHYIMPNDEPSIIALGSKFENLCIAGCPVKVELNHDFFLHADTFEAIRKELASNSDFRKIAEDPFQTGQPHKLSKDPGVVICTLVKSMTTACPSLKPKVNTIEIPQFGKVFVAEIIAQHSRRTLTMLRLELGSPVCGPVMAAQVQGNGTTYP